jgi:pSer/pThr/pTyr-binding forkhead associated (FHA) protein
VPRAFLIDTYGFTNQMRHELGAKPTMLGRVAGTDSEHINYVVVGFSTVSRRHAVIEYKESAFFIADQGSLNGTYVNDQQISGDVRLMHGDRLRINRFEFEFVISDLMFSGKTREVRRPVSTMPEPILVDEIEEEESPDLDKTIEAGKKSGSEKMVDALKFDTVRSVGVKVRSGMYKAERGGKVQYVHVIRNWVLPQPRRKENNLWLVAQGIGTWNQKGFR